MIRKSRVVVFDTETTGIDTATDRVVEIGAVAFEGGVLTEEFHGYINPGRPIPAEASSVHGITDVKVKDSPKFEEKAQDIVDFLKGAQVLCGYNAAGYDAPLLNAEFERAGYEYRIRSEEVLDPVIFVRWYFREMRSRKLGDMCAYLGITLDHAHTAVADATATAHLLYKLLGKHIPSTIEEALEQQAHFKSLQEEEFRRWGYWLFVDRYSGQLCIGAGKHSGTLLSLVDAGFLNWILNKIPDLHPGARRALEMERLRRTGVTTQKPMSAKRFLRSAKT